MANEAVWLTEFGGRAKLGPADVHEPGEGELLIQVGSTSKYDNYAMRLTQ